MPWLFPSFASSQTLGSNILPAGNFESVQSTYVPWAGVDDNGNIHCIEGQQIAVGEDGHIGSYRFAPSVAAADLSGDGKPDLVVADSMGFFWFFPNSGTVQTPAFTQGEVMPIWLGEEKTWGGAEGADNVVPRIQLFDLDKTGKLDIFAGTYAGKFFHIPNVGSSAQPYFKPTYDRDDLMIPTHKKGVLWCNYLAPFLTSLFGSPNSIQLVLGDGTYSANSIYLLNDTNSGGSPAFDEDHLQRIIPGMGLEQLTPAVVDWNNDGKPDVICGDRTGYLNLYLNNSTDFEHLTFAPCTHVKIAGVENFGNSITVSIADLNNNHLPNLLVGRNDGTILYAQNTGKLGEPKFDTPSTPLKGVLPPNYHYIAPTAWQKYGAFGAPYELLSCVNPQVEPGFTFPDGEHSKYALKFGVWPFKSVYFPVRYYPKTEDEWREHVIRCNQAFTVELNKRYRVHCWIKADGNVSDFRMKMNADWSQRQGFHASDVVNEISAGSDWQEVSWDFRIADEDDPTVTTWNYWIEFRFTGQTTFYVDDLEIQKELQ